LVLDLFIFTHFGCYFDAALVLDRMVVVVLIKAEGGVLERIREELEGRRLSSVSTTPRQLGLFGATWHVKTFS
jgi:hypothetical protein